MTAPALAELIGPISAIAQMAGKVIMRYYDGGFEVRNKANNTPVTDADEAAEKLILAELSVLTPDVQIISEEAAAAGHMPEATELFWSVDPLDGTKEFINHNGEFAVCIGLVQDYRPVFGVIHGPALGVTYSAAGPGTAKCQDQDQGTAPYAITARPAPEDGVIVISSRSHQDRRRLKEYLANVQVASRSYMGSALKFGLLAKGEADLYPRFGNTCDWDTAAGQAILEAAGGSIETFDGAPLRYGKPEYLNPGFVASGPGSVPIKRP